MLRIYYRDDGEETPASEEAGYSKFRENALLLSPGSSDPGIAAASRLLFCPRTLLD